MEKSALISAEMHVHAPEWHPAGSLLTRFALHVIDLVFDLVQFSKNALIENRLSAPYPMEEH